MKRYVREYANDLMKLVKEEKTKNRIKNIIAFEKEGMITSFEAIKALTEIYEQMPV